MADAHEADRDRNSEVGTDKLHFVETRNTHVESTSHTEKVIAAIGIDNLVIVDTPDALVGGWPRQIAGCQAGANR